MCMLSANGRSEALHSLCARLFCQPCVNSILSVSVLIWVLWCCVMVLIPLFNNSCLLLCVEPRSKLHINMGFVAEGTGLIDLRMCVRLHTYCLCAL